MRNDVILKRREEQPLTPNETLKATALIYLQDALFNQMFEECPELIRVAKGFGAEQSEIKDAIAQGVRGVRAGQRSGAYQEEKGRLRF